MKMNERNFEILIGRIDGHMFPLSVHEVYPLQMDFLNFFCGLNPLEWIGKTSHHRVVVMTDEIKIGIANLVSKYKKDFDTASHLALFFEDIEVGVPFFFLRRGLLLRIDKRLICKAYSILAKCYKRYCFSELAYGYGSEKVYVGHNKYSERTCRFCGKKYPDVRFKDDNAHAIPDGLGNKLLFCHDECTSCNNRLNNAFEKDFVVYLDIRRAEAGIKGKRKIPTVYGHNYKLDGAKKELSISKYAILGETDSTYLIKLEGASEIEHINLYKALVKFVINLSEEDMLPNFATAIRWLNGEFIPPVIPDVWYCYNIPTDAVSQPRIRIYRRNDGLTYKSGPYCLVELDIIDLTFVFIMPFADKGHFLTNDKVEPFINHFITIADKAIIGREQIDMSDRQKKFAHVITTVQKSHIKVVPHEIFETLQEHEKDMIDFPNIDEKRINITIGQLYSSSRYKSESLTFEQSVISSDVKYPYISPRKFIMKGYIVITDQTRMQACNEWKVFFSVSIQSEGVGEIVGVANDHKGEQIVEFNGHAILLALEKVASRLKVLYCKDLPAYDFLRLPEIIMERMGIIVNPNMEAEKSIMPH